MLNIRKRFFLLLTIVGLLFSLASCTKKNDYIEVKFEASEYVIVVGETIDVVPTINKGESVQSYELVYVSQDDKIASYSDAKVTGVSVGQTVVKAYVANKAIAYDTVVITVIQDRLPGMEFSGADGSILKGESRQIECAFTPADAEADVALSYASSNPEVAAVDEKGLITTLKAGKTTITIVATNLLYDKESRTYEFELEVLESDFSINYELNGGQNAATNPAGYNVFNLPIALADASKTGYTFAGWYDNAEFAGEPLTEIAANSRGDITLYAKWDIITYTVSYDLAGGEGAESNPTTYTVEDAPYKLAEPTLYGYNFLGWYAGEEKVEELTLGNLELVAKWELAKYTVSYDLNGGDWSLNIEELYEYGKDFGKLVADFVVDFNAHSGKTVAADGSDFFARSWMADGSSAGYSFLVSDKYGAKWAWLLELINETRVARGAAPLSAADGQAEARGEVHCFLNAISNTAGKTAGYGSDYSGIDTSNSLWSKLLKIDIVNSYDMNTETFAIPTPVRLGQEFLGWFDAEGNKVEKVEKGSTGNLDLVAKWELDEYTITYNYNGGALDNIDLSNATPVESGKLTRYLSFNGNGYEASLHTSQRVWWYHIALKETAKAGVYQIVQLVASNKVTEEYDLLIVWHSSLKDADAKATLNKMFNNSANYLGDFIAFENVPAESSTAADITFKVYDYADATAGVEEPVTSFIYTDSVIELHVPVKPRNEFVGWYLDGEKVTSINPAIAKDVVLEAKWSNDPIAIEYVLNEGQLPEGAATTFTYAEGLATLPTPTRLGYTFLGWYADEACTEKVESIEKGLLESVKLYASWELTVYEITYELNGGQFIRDEIVDEYDSFEALVAEFIADYAALTGVEGVTAANFYGKSAKYGLYAFFKNEEMAAKWNWLLEFVAANAEKVGYAGKTYLSVSAGAANFNKYARSNFAALLQQTMITTVSPISMNFETVDGEEFWAACPDKTIQVGTESVNEYTIVELPVKLAAPNKKEATFVGWYTNSDLKNGKVEEITLDLLGDITLYARWSDSEIKFDTYTITYELNGGTLEEGAPTSYIEETGVALAKGATRSGYEFKGWFLDAECTKAVTEFTALDKGDKSVYASWEAIEYEIKYNAGEGTLPTITIQVGDYADWAALVADFVVDFNKFSGKTVKADGSDFFARSYMGDGSSAGYNFLTSAAYKDKWGGLLIVINEARVARGVAELSSSDGQAEARGELQNLLTKSSKDAGVTAGYGSDYTSEEVWGKVWDHFELIHDEEIPAPTFYTVEDLPYTLAIPGAPENKQFAGWYNNAELTGDAIYELPVGTLGTIELWAKYVAKEYAINYELNNGVNNEANPSKYTSEEEVTLVAPSREGYEFQGWELNGEKVEKITLGTKGDLTLVATWAPKVYSIEYILNEGVLPEGAPTEFEHDSKVVLPTPSREGYIFLGWILNNQYVEELEYCDYVLEAKWKANDQTGYEVIFDLNGGEFEGKSLDSFAKELVEDFNNLTESDKQDTTIKNFHNTTSRNVKYVFSKPEMLAKYKWFLQFALDELKTHNAEKLDGTYMTETVAMLEGMIAGDTTAVKGDYANGRTLFRHFIHGLINKCLPNENAAYTSYSIDFSVEENMNRFFNVYAPVQQTVEPNEELPIAVRENYIFLGWYVNGVKVEKVSGDDVLVAEWIHVDDYEWEVEFDLAGGYWLYADLDDFADKFVEEFSKVSGATIDRVNFKGTTGTPIKNFLNKADILAKYKWLLEFSLSEISTYTDMAKLESSEKTFYDNTILMLEGMIAGDTNAVNINDEGHARTIYRWYLQGLLNKTLAPAPVGMYDHFMVDYSVEENLNRFLEALELANKAAVEETYTAKDKLPTPNKDGHLFLGWFDGETEVKVVRANCKLVAKWVDTSTLKYTISYDVAEGILPEGATTEFGYNATVVLPVPTREGYKFLGWYEGETLIETIENRNYELVAKWEAQNAKLINYELNGGKLPEGAATEYIVGKGLETLPTPTRSGYEFLGWYSDAACTQVVTLISADANEDVTLYAQWKKEEVKVTEVYVGEGKDYATLDEAIAGVEDNTRIILAAGEYTLGTAIDKSVEIVGPNANKEYSQFATDEAIVNVTRDVSGNLKAANIKFNGVHLKGTGGGAGIQGVYFQDGGNIETLTFTSCVISDMNTFVKLVDGKSSLELTVEKSYMHTIGQFILWVASSANKTILRDNYVDGSSCGAVTSQYATLFRTRYGALEAYNNYFKGDQANEHGYFELTCGPSVVKYNTFENVTKFVYTTKNNNVVFDQNLYLDANGNPLPTAPATLKSEGLTADTTVALNAEDLHNSYIKYLKESNPNRYFDVTFNAGNGEITSIYPEVYDSEAGIASLPTAECEGYEFVGWLLNGELVEVVPAGTTGNITLVALYKEAGLYVGEGQQYATITEALAAAKEGDTIIVLAGTYNESITISLADLTIKGPNAGVNPNTETRNAEAVLTGTITIATAARNVTIDGLAFTGAAKVLSSCVYGLTFQNNYAYNTDAPTAAWKEGTGYVSGFVSLGESATSKDVQFIDNKFENVKDVNVNISDICNVSFDGNVFKNFGYDAIRFDDSTYNYGYMSFTNNEFVNDTPSGYNGIYFRSYGGPGSNDNVITIKGNKFVNIGNATNAASTLYVNAISARNNQEHGTVWTIADNYFEACYNYIRIRNNGTVANHTTYLWSCKVENNSFIGLPTSTYFAVWNNSDNDPAQNPETTVFGANYYEDNNGAVISDLAAYASYFKNVATYGTVLGVEPEDGEAEAYEIYSITYDLDGGSTRDEFVYNYSSLLDTTIVLPELTKANHQFNGWLLNGELVKEITVGTKGNLELVAQFTVLEGEIYNIEYVTNKENVIWPSRAAYDRYEIYDALYADLYEWAQGNGETRTYEDYKTYIYNQIADYQNVNFGTLKIRNSELGNYPAEDGSTEFFFNIPKYYQKWADFFAVFHKAMLAVNSGQSFYTDDYAAGVRLYQFLSWNSTGEGYYKGFLNEMCAATKVPQEIAYTYRGGQIVVLPELSMANGLEFLGWYDNAEFTGEAVAQITTTDTGDKKFYAKWAEEIKPEKVEINKVNELLLFTTHQLVWSITPENATDKSVEFFSSNEAVATVSAKGLITALANGTTTITMKVYGNREIDVVFDLTVYTEDLINGSYYSTSYVEKDDSIQLLAEIIKKDGTKSAVKWSSLTPEIATVDENGVVTGLKAGLAKIVATDPNNESLKLEFTVSVLEGELNDVLQFIVESNENNVFVEYNLGIGSGIPEYYMDIFGSVSKLLMNEKLVIDDTRKDTEVTNGTKDYYDMSSVEFITVHYTGNMKVGADALANAKYFVGDNSVSIHYTTGNDGVYQALTHDKGAWHAGDSGSYAGGDDYKNTDGSTWTGVGEFKWMPTGVKVGANDPKYPVFTISDDFYYEINGQKTPIEMAKPYNYKLRNTDHVLNADGTISSKSGYGQDAFTNRTPESFINDMGLPFKIVGDEYYMGSTWWCYTQVYEGRICSTGGNRNSIGIESCVDKGSDLWFTWQKTAQLVAKLMVDTQLDITKVRGHHFYSGKDCPQPMLENNLEIWWEFLDLVEAEHELLTQYNDYEISFESHNPEIVDNNGRVVKQPAETTCVTYTVTITKDGQTQTITLASMVQGLYVGR